MRRKHKRKSGWDGWHKFKKLDSIFTEIYISLPTVVESDPKVPFSIAITARCMGERYSIPWVAPLNLDPYYTVLCVKQGSLKYHFTSLCSNSTWDRKNSYGQKMVVQYKETGVFLLWLYLWDLFIFVVSWNIPHSLSM